MRASRRTLIKTLGAVVRGRQPRACGLPGAARCRRKLVRGAALTYGAYSLDTDTPSQRACGSGAYFLGTAEITRYWNEYLPTAAARENPRAVPMLADLAGVPPLYVAACEFDPLRDDSERLAARAKSAGIDITFREWKGVVHAAVSLMGWIDSMGPDVDRIGEFLRRVTG